MENEIEDDLKIVQKYLENSAYTESNSDFFKNGGWEVVNLEIPRAMKNILEEYERLQTENRYINGQIFDRKYIHESKVQEFLKEIDKLIYEMRQNGSQYWANRLEKLKEKEEEK